MLLAAANPLSSSILRGRQDNTAPTPKNEQHTAHQEKQHHRRHDTYKARTISGDDEQSRAQVENKTRTAHAGCTNVHQNPTFLWSHICTYMRAITGLSGPSRALPRAPHINILHTLHIVPCRDTCARRASSRSWRCTWRPLPPFGPCAASAQSLGLGQHRS